MLQDYMACQIQSSQLHEQMSYINSDGQNKPNHHCNVALEVGCLIGTPDRAPRTQRRALCKLPQSKQEAL
jgi:hypothetical protein